MYPQSLSESQSITSPTKLPIQVIYRTFHKSFELIDFLGKTSADCPPNTEKGSSETADNTFTTPEQEEIIKVEPLDPDADVSGSSTPCPDDENERKPKKIQLKISS